MGRHGCGEAGPAPAQQTACTAACTAAATAAPTSCPEHSCSTRLFSLLERIRPMYRFASATDPNTSTPAASTAASSAAASAAATAMSGLPPAAAAAAPAAAAVAATMAAVGPLLGPCVLPPPPAESPSLAPGQVATAGDAECNSSCSRLGERPTTCARGAGSSKAEHAPRDDRAFTAA